MKKLHTIYLFIVIAALAITTTSCSYQNYSAAEASFAPLTNDSYVASTGWNADNFHPANPVSVPTHRVPKAPYTRSIIVTSK